MGVAHPSLFSAKGGQARTSAECIAGRTWGRLAVGGGGQSGVPAPAAKDKDVARIPVAIPVKAGHCHAIFDSNCDAIDGDIHNSLRVPRADRGYILISKLGASFSRRCAKAAIYRTARCLEFGRHRSAASGGLSGYSLHYGLSSSLPSCGPDRLGAFAT